MNYNFNPENCWYKKVCRLYDTDRCDNHCIRFSQMKHLIESSKLPKTLCFPIELEPQVIDLAAFVQLAQIKENIVDFVKQGKNLYIFSANTGNGKTTWTAKLLLRYFEKVWSTNAYADRGLFIPVTDFLISMRLSGYNNPNNISMIQKIKTVDLVVWDDIAVGELTAQDLDLLYSLINARIMNGLSNVFTGNLNGEQLYSILGPRMYSRIWESSIRAEFRGTDRRGQE